MRWTGCPPGVPCQCASSVTNDVWKPLEIDELVKFGEKVSWNLACMCKFWKGSYNYRIVLKSAFKHFRQGFSILCRRQSFFRYILNYFIHHVFLFEKLIWMLHNIQREKRKRSDSVLWQKPWHQQKKIPTSKMTTQKRLQKHSIAQRLRAD